MLQLPMKEIALICITCTELLFMIVANDMKDPITGSSRSYSEIADLVGIVERLNVAIGEDPNIELRKMMEQLRERGE